MTNNEVYRLGKEMLLKANIDDASTEVVYIFYHCFNLDRHGLILNSDKIADEDRVNLYFEMIKKRTTGMPLQYILGEWEFMDLKFKVGDGVLIPREDTRLLVDTICPYLEKIHNPKILDLCAGSGAISIKLSKLFPSSKIFAVELSDKALQYLNYNIKLNKAKNVSIIKADVLTPPKDDLFHDIDLIVSNPPYIRTEEINKLQREVKFEPVMALDGGQDGLKFYRAIAEHWLKFLKPNGLLAVEIGNNQSKEVSSLFLKRRFSIVGIFKDLADIDRTLVFRKVM